MNALGTYFFEIVVGKEIFVTAFAAVCGLGQVTGLLIMPKFAKKHGKKKVIQTAFTLAIVGDLLMLVLSFFFLKFYEPLNATTMIFGGKFPLGVFLLFIPFAILAFTSCIGIGMSFTAQTVMLSDIVDYGEYKQGSRNDSTVFSMKSFLLKFALTTQTAITGLGLALSGTDKIYEGIQADITAAEEVGKKLTIDYASRFDFSQKLTVSMMMFAIPPILCIIALIIFNKKYRLYGDLENKVNEFVVEKHKNDIVDKRDKLTQIVEKVNDDIRSGE